MKFPRRHYPLKKLWDFGLQDLENFISWKKCTFYEFSKIFEFYLPLNRRVLTKCWLKYSRSIRNLLLMFFIFWVMIISPKLKKYLMVQTPPTHTGGRPRCVWLILYLLLSLCFLHSFMWHQKYECKIFWYTIATYWIHGSLYFLYYL